MYETSGGWNKKLDFGVAGDLYYNDHEGWDRIDGKLLKVEIYYLFKTGEDQQQDMNIWVDDNNIGYFYSSVCFTESGTVNAYNGDKIGVGFVFQKEEDALAFKLKWT